MAVLIASDLAKDMAGEPLLRGVSFKLERRERLTIAGRNGAGKTTLLRMLAGETSIDGGELVLSKGVRVALHDQRPPRERDISLRDYVLSGSREPLELEAELGHLEQAMAAGEERALDRYSDVYARFEAAGGYGWRERARSVVHGLSFADDDLDRPLRTFSGGQLTRGSLARALAAQPDLLLLDEPTNHLDIESLEWLEKTLLELDAAVVLVAHDRWFLETVGTAVLELEFKKPERSGRVIFELEDGRLEVPGKVLLDDAELWLERGEHVSLVGPNGTGKTTLIEALVGARELDGGKLRRGHNVKVGYLSQHAEELEAGGARTVLEAAQKRTGLSPNQARALLGRLLFSGDEAEKPLDGLSGGERRRLSLAILVSSGANVLILDEPTNHLDIESREALEDALRSFPGSLLLVTHDRALLDAVGSRTVAVEDRELHSSVGGWPEYARLREERKARGESPASASGAAARAPRPAKPARVNGDGDGAPEKRAKSVAPAKPAGPSKNRQREQAKLERAIEDAEAALAALEDELADPKWWATKYESAKSTARHTAAKRAVEEAYAKLEAFEESAPA